jgi:hypothetical protein
MRMFLLTFASFALPFLYLRYLLFRVPELSDEAIARIRSCQRLGDGILALLDSDTDTPDSSSKEPGRMSDWL